MGKRDKFVNTKEFFALHKTYKECLKYERRLKKLFRRLEKILKERKSNVPQYEIDKLYRRSKKTRKNLREKQEILKHKMKNIKGLALQGKISVKSFELWWKLYNNVTPQPENGIGKPSFITILSLLILLHHCHLQRYQLRLPQSIHHYKCCSYHPKEEIVNGQVLRYPSTSQPLLRTHQNVCGPALLVEGIFATLTQLRPRSEAATINALALRPWQSRTYRLTCFIKLPARQSVFIAFSFEETVTTLTTVAALLQLCLTPKAASNHAPALRPQGTTEYLLKCFLQLVAPQATLTPFFTEETYPSLTPVAATLRLWLTYGAPSLRARRGTDLLLTCSLPLPAPSATETTIFSELIPVERPSPVTLLPETASCNATALTAVGKGENSSQLASTISSVEETATVQMQPEQSCISELSEPSPPSLADEALSPSRNGIISEDKDENMTIERKKKRRSTFKRFFSSLFCCFGKQKQK